MFMHFFPSFVALEKDLGKSSYAKWKARQFQQNDLLKVHETHLTYNAHTCKQLCGS